MDEKIPFGEEPVARELNDSDAYGQAAILLIESLIHELIDRSILSVTTAIEIVDSAAEVAEEIAGDSDEASGTLRQAVNILVSISSSLSHDHRR